MFVVTLCALALIAGAARAELKTLTDANFEQMKKEHKYLFVKMFAPWCGHCKALAPKWEELANDASLADLGIAVFEADCTGEAKGICNKNGVQGFPTIKLLTSAGAAYEYEGGREVADFVKWAPEIIKPGIVSVASMAAAEAAFKDAAVSSRDTYYVFTGPELEPEFETYIASLKTKHFFAYVKDAQRALIAIREGEKITLEAPKGFAKVPVGGFIQQHRYPFMPIADKSNFGDLTRSGRIPLFIVYDKDAENQMDLSDKMRKVAHDIVMDPTLSKEYAWVNRRYFIAAMDAGEWADFLENPGLSADHTPFLMLYRPGSKPKYGMRELTEESLQDQALKVFTDYKAGTFKLSLFNKEDREKAAGDKEL